MAMLKAPPFMVELIELGIQPTIENRKDYGICYNLNTMAKSDMILYEKDGQWRVAMRYDEDFAVDDIKDIAHYARHAMHGRDYISAFFVDLLKEY